MINVKTLNTYAAIHGTDKLSHGYVAHYAKHLPDKCEALLEVGAFRGASLRMWKDLYPKAAISCFDLFLDPLNISKEEVESMGIKAYQGDQCYPADLAQIQGEFDVIIEDGSHRSDHQVTTFTSLWSKVKPGGVYIVEDLHCCEEPFYWGEFTKFEDTLLHRIQDTDFHKTWWDTIPGVDRIELHDEKIAFIFKYAD